MKIISETEIEFPFVVTKGNTKVKIYRVKSATNAGERYFQVADYTKSKDANGNPKRTLISFADFDAAKAEAKRIAERMAEGDVIGASIRGADVLRYQEAVQILNGDSAKLVEAAKFYVARHPKDGLAKPLADVVEEMMSVKVSRRKSDRYLQDLRHRLNRFAIDFGARLTDEANKTGAIKAGTGKKLAEIDTRAIQSWLDGLGLSPQSYVNYRTVLFGLFAFAETRGYIAKGTNPVDSVERLTMGEGEVEVFTPGEFRAILDVCPDDYLPSLTIGGFAGLRSAEIQRLDWSDIDLQSGFITVSASKAKTASRRTVPICPALSAWLAKFEGPTGKVWCKNGDAFVNTQRRIAKDAGIKWKGNALRHSYASYRLADTADATRVAFELGNSPAVVHRHYKELVRPEAAKAWFSILPKQ